MARKQRDREIIETNECCGEMTLADQIAMGLAGLGTKEAEAMKNKLVCGTLRMALESKPDGKASHMQIITAKYIEHLEDPDYQVDSKDMLAMQRLMGEDISKSQRVNVTLSSTDDFLSQMSIGDKDEDK